MSTVQNTQPKGTIDALQAILLGQGHRTDDAALVGKRGRSSERSRGQAWSEALCVHGDFRLRTAQTAI